jgi:hypothetical protein
MKKEYKEERERTNIHNKRERERERKVSSKIPYRDSS